MAITNPDNHPLQTNGNMVDTTSYTGTKGDHTDVTKHATAKTNVMPTRNLRGHDIPRLHGKDPRRRKHNRNSTESSMSAFTKKMKKISSNKMKSVSSKTSSSSALSSISDCVCSRTGDQWTFSRNSTLHDGEFQEKCYFQTKEDGEDGAKRNENKGMGIFCDSSLGMDSDSVQESTSGNVTFSDNFDTVTVHADIRTNYWMRPRSSASRGFPIRRSGSYFRPDSSRVKSSARKTRSKSGRIVVHSGTQRDSKSVPEEVCWDPCISITPFPELRVRSSKTKTEKSKSTNEPLDSIKSQSTETNLPQITAPKFTKTRENYWSFRKAYPRYNLAAAASTTTSNKTSQQPVDTTLPPLPTLPKPVKKVELKPLPPRKTFFQSFRYSDVVKTVMTILDKSDNDDDNAVQRVSEILPTLDIQDLKESKRAGRRGGRRRHAQSGRSDVFSVVAGKGAEVLCAHDGRCEDWFLCAMSRDKSLSLADVDTEHGIE